MPPSFLLLLPIFLIFRSSLPFSFDVSYHIDCGSSTNTTDQFNTTWISDRFFTGGSAGIVSEPLRFKNPQEKTLRFFPLSSGKKNCYVVPVPSGRYFFREFTVYNNYDGKSHAPSFDVSVEGTQVFSWRSPWFVSSNLDGSYSDLFADVADGQADFCLYSIATDPPVIGSLEIIQVHPTAYAEGGSSLLVNYGRFSCGENQWGPGLTSDPDPFGRTWVSDVRYRVNGPEYQNVPRVNHPIANTNSSPNYYPERLYQTAVKSTSTLEYELQVDAKLDYLLIFHFAEIDPMVTSAATGRIIDVMVNGKKISRVNIFAEVGQFAAYSFTHIVHNLSSTSIRISLQPASYDVLLSGIENYAMVPRDAVTVSEQVSAMRALKKSLRVPDRMGWNGDPCAPTSWDAWEGVTCRAAALNGTPSLVISQIDLGSQGLKGYVCEEIALLTNLVSLNLSSNSLEGSLPSGLGHKSLTRLDLSNNQFTGAIPDSLTTSGLNLLLLNNNQLSGKVAVEIYSIGLHGGSIDLSGNKGLCGVPSLPKCSLLWDNDGLSTGGKVAIAVSLSFVALVVLLAAAFCYVRRRRFDYDFAPTHDLMSLAAKRNRYHRQKSLMHLEMESLHAKGLPSQ